MKALEILKLLRDWHSLYGENTITVYPADRLKFIQAITELEALQDEVKDAEWRLELCLTQQRALLAHRSCDGCLLLNSRTCTYCSRKVSLTDYYQRTQNY
jgi:hypothetical protein